MPYLIVKTYHASKNKQELNFFESLEITKELEEIRKHKKH